MCGILCVFGHAEKDRERARRAALRCAKKLQHRGPDYGGVYQDDQAVLCHQRLAIVDPASGAQPMVNGDETSVVCVNGEIYNHADLRKSIPEYKAKSTSDCEVLLPLYDRFGADMVQLLGGMFAFVLYQPKTGVVFAARDHVGINPLYYGRGSDGSLWLSSELKAIASVCKKILEFPVGHYMKINISELLSVADLQPFLTRWYQPRWFDTKLPPPSKLSLDEALVQLREQFEASVHRHLMADVPVGVLLSGGLDSSLVTAITAKKLREQEQSSTPKARAIDFAAPEPQESNVPTIKTLRSFCIGLKDSPDLKAAREVASFCGLHHFEFTFTIEEGLDALSDVIHHIETFDVTTCRASTPMFLMARKIKALGIKTVLSGEGADEVFGGYLYFHKAPNAAELQQESVDKVRGLHQFDCLRANKSTAAWGVECRVPFLDKAFLDFAMSLDPAEKMPSKHGIEKWLLRKAFEGYLPDSVLWRQKEQFSDGVGYSWIDALKDKAERLVTDEMMQRAAFVFPTGTPTSKEEYMYREIFEQHFPSGESNAAATVPRGPSIACSTARVMQWDKAFSSSADPSGRAVGVHLSATAKSKDKA